MSSDSLHPIFIFSLIIGIIPGRQHGVVITDAFDDYGTLAEPETAPSPETAGEGGNASLMYTATAQGTAPSTAGNAAAVTGLGPAPVGGAKTAEAGGSAEGPAASNDTSAEPETAPSPETAGGAT